MEQLLHTAVDFLVGKFGDHHRENIKVFVAQLYSHLPAEDFSKLRIEEIGEGLTALFQLFVKRPKGQMNHNVYFWHPRNGAVAWFVANSGRADLYCNGYPSDSGGVLGVRAAKQP